MARGVSGDNESAGKHSLGTTRPGDPWLKSIPAQAAISPSRSTDTHLAARCRRLMARRGCTLALVALQHSPGHLVAVANSSLWRIAPRITQ